jgi:hypothetical protein
MKINELYFVFRRKADLISVSLEYFANRVPCRIGLEACGGAYHWARHLTAMGHPVGLMPARYKNDATDARAIWLAVQQPFKAVAMKSEMQQAMLARHRMREQWGEVPDDADQRATRTAGRVRRSDGSGPGGVVIPAKAGIQFLDFSGFPPSRISANI